MAESVRARGHVRSASGSHFSFELAKQYLLNSNALQWARKVHYQYMSCLHLLS